MSSNNKNEIAVVDISTVKDLLTVQNEGRIRYNEAQ